MQEEEDDGDGHAEGERWDVGVQEVRGHVVPGLYEFAGLDSLFVHSPSNHTGPEVYMFGYLLLVAISKHVTSTNPTENNLEVISGSALPTQASISFMKSMMTIL